MKYIFLLLLSVQTAVLFGQTKQYNGTWTKVNTTYEFDFELTLKEVTQNRVEGYFVWTVVQYDENEPFARMYYEGKLGMTAIEFVRGNFDSSTGLYILKGYKKDDPNLIIGMDTYKLILDDDGGIEGTTRANNSWLGRIKGEPFKQNSI